MRFPSPVSSPRRLLPIFVLGLLARPLLAADATVLDPIFAANISDRAEKKRFVYEALRSTADATQAPLRRRLERAGARFQAFYLVNMIAVEADRPLAEELASRDDVVLVAPNRPVHMALPRRQEPEVAPLSATAVEASLDLVH